MGQVDGKIAGLDEKIQKLEQELRGYRDKMKRTRPGPQQNRLKQQALRCELYPN